MKYRLHTSKFCGMIIAGEVAPRENEAARSMIGGFCTYGMVIET
jgi:hypothetical protein